MHTLKCVDKDGKEEFFILKSHRSHDEQKIHYSVHTEPAPSSGEFFELTIEDLGNEFKVVAMFNHGEKAFKKKGIPDALLVYIASTHGKPVCSSRTTGPHGEYRTQDATKVWDRLVTNNTASYFPDEDVYRIL